MLPIPPKETDNWLSISLSGILFFIISGAKAIDKIEEIKLRTTNIKNLSLNIFNPFFIF